MMDERVLPIGVMSSSLAWENHSETAIHLPSRRWGTVVWQFHCLAAHGVLPDSKISRCHMMCDVCPSMRWLWFIRECFNSDKSNALSER